MSMPEDTFKKREEAFKVFWECLQEWHAEALMNYRYGVNEATGLLAMWDGEGGPEDITVRPVPNASICEAIPEPEEKERALARPEPGMFRLFVTRKNRLSWADFPIAALRDKLVEEFKA